MSRAGFRKLKLIMAKFLITKTYFYPEEAVIVEAENEDEALRKAFSEPVLRGEWRNVGFFQDIDRESQKAFIKAGLVKFTKHRDFELIQSGPFFGIYRV